jgi:hypothetical protein
MAPVFQGAKKGWLRRFPAILRKQAGLGGRMAVSLRDFRDSGAGILVGPNGSKTPLHPCFAAVSAHPFAKSTHEIC